MTHPIRTQLYPAGHQQEGPPRMGLVQTKVSSSFLATVACWGVRHQISVKHSDNFDCNRRYINKDELNKDLCLWNEWWWPPAGSPAGEPLCVSDWAGNVWGLPEKAHRLESRKKSKTRAEIDQTTKCSLEMNYQILLILRIKVRFISSGSTYVSSWRPCRHKPLLNVWLGLFKADIPENHFKLF